MLPRRSTCEMMAPTCRVAVPNPPGTGLSRGWTASGGPSSGARREALLEFEAEPEIRDLLEETLGNARKALGI